MRVGEWERHVLAVMRRATDDDKTPVPLEVDGRRVGQAEAWALRRAFDFVRRDPAGTGTAAERIAAWLADGEPDVYRAIRRVIDLLRADHEGALLLTAAPVDLGGGVAALEALDSAGDVVYVVGPPGAGTVVPASPPHEQTGPLPKDWKRRAGIICGASAANGPCRNVVARYGERCRSHREAPR